MTDLNVYVLKDSALPPLLDALRGLIAQARQQVLRHVDQVQVQTCWQIGRHIVEVISANPYTKQAGRIKMSHLGRSGFRSSLDSTACMASLPRETPF